MASYMIFVDDALATEANAITAKYGLKEIETDGSLTWIFCQMGPGGKSGLLGFWLNPTLLKTGSFNPLTQKWVSVPHELGGLWVGTYLDDPMKPSDVVRPKPFDRSLSVILEDGNRWMIPVARWLPHVWGQTAKGEFERKPADRFAEFCTEAEEVFQCFMNADEGRDLEIQCQWDFVCQALSLNYKLCPSLISALGLIGDRSAGRILAATIELHMAQEVDEQKKS